MAQATYQSLMDQMGFEVRLANTRAQQARKQAETSVRAAQERLRILGVKPDGTEPEVERRQGRRRQARRDAPGAEPAASPPSREAGDDPPAEKPRSNVGRRAGRGPA